MNYKNLAITIFITTVVSTLLSVTIIRNFFTVSVVGSNTSAGSSQSVGMATVGENKPALIKSDCLEDSKKFCENELSDIRKDACLQDHYQEVSSGCKEILTKTRSSFSDCDKEIQKFCAKAGFGGGRMIKCLQDIYEELGNLCKARVGKPN